MYESQKIPVVIVGGGSIAPYHAKYIISSPTCQLVAIIDPFQSGRDLASTLSVSHFNTISDLVASTLPQAAIYYICVPSGLHTKLATEVINLTTARVMLVEKPLSTDSSSGQALLNLAESRSTPAIIAAGHHRRFHPAIKAAKAAIQANRVGKVTAISGLWTCKKNDSYFSLAWRLSRSQGGGPIWTNFVHDIDLLHHLVGANVTRVWVASTPRVRNHTIAEPTDLVEEGAAIMFLFGNGVVGTFIVSDNVASPYFWEHATGENPLMPRVNGAGIDCFRVFGTEGTLTVPNGELWRYSTDDATKSGLEVGWNVPMTREILEVQGGIPFRDQLANLAGVVMGTEKLVCSGEDGLAAVKVCEAVLKALDDGDGSPVDIV